MMPGGEIVRPATPSQSTAMKGVAMPEEAASVDEFLAEADAFIEANWDEIVDEIAALVAVPSVVDFKRATAEDPSGPEAHEGLRAAVELAQRLGFDAWDDAGEIGIADMPGERDEHLAMICHADVVAPGVGWTGDPWTLERRDGFLIGRGVLDDKGPLVISLYCMKFFKERCERLGTRLPYTLRMLMGTNEETGTMRDVRYYLAHYSAPAFLFTPDNAFPACYGEKGQFDIAITSSEAKGRIMLFTTGDSSTNAVPSQATMVVYGADAADLPAREGIEVANQDFGCVRITATGRGGHASTPEGTVNAIDMLVKYALDNGLYMPAKKACSTPDEEAGRGTAGESGATIGSRAASAASPDIEKELGLTEFDPTSEADLLYAEEPRLLANPHEDGPSLPEEESYLRLIGRIMDSTDGSSIGIDTSDEYFGPLTCIVGTIHRVGGRLRVTLDIRYPTSTSHDELLAAFEKLAAEAGATVELTGGLPPFLTSPDSPAIQALASAYRDATGLDGEPFTIGGGTYAREFPRAASFGPEDPHDAYPDWVGPMHGADEGVSEESLKRAMRVYMLTIARLMELDLTKLSE